MDGYGHGAKWPPPRFRGKASVEEKGRLVHPGTAGDGMYPFVHSTACRAGSTGTGKTYSAIKNTAKLCATKLNGLR